MAHIKVQIVVSIMLSSLIFNRRRDYKIAGRGSSTTRLLPETVHDDHSPDRASSDDEGGLDIGVKHPSKRRNCCFAVVKTPNSSRFANHYHSRILQKFPFLVEMFYWALNYLAYSFTKAFADTLYATSDKDNGVTLRAQEHGIGILKFEHESVFKFLFPVQEADFQAFFLNHQTALTLVNRLYSLVHIPGTVAFLSWYYYAAPNHATFAVARRTMTLGNFAAFIIFCFYPCMPPRLLPKRFHFHDTVRQGNAESVWVGGKNVNQLAAMPSLHFTYAFIIGCTFLYHSGIARTIRYRKRSKSVISQAVFTVLGFVYPAIVLTVIVATANHYYLDAVVATFTVTLSFLCNRAWMILLPAEDMLLWALRLEKPVPTTGDRLRTRSGRGRRRKVDEDESAENSS